MGHFGIRKRQYAHLIQKVIAKNGTLANRHESFAARTR
jgi:hypothetical protein